MKIPHFLYILIVKFSCLYGTVDGLIRTISTGDVHWVVAEQHESQVDACGRIGKISLLFRNEYLPWNVEAFIDVVVNKLGRKVDRAAGSTGLLGCCVPGLWCGADGCFTQGYGPSFRNYGWLSNVTQAFPVFACSNDTTSSTDLAITSQSFSKGKLIVSGKGFQWDESSIRTMIGSEVCYEPELCYSEICNVCSASNPCPVGSICLTFAAEGTSFCFTSCEGLTDKSCPCDFSCYGIKIGEGTDELFVCAPERLRSNGNLCSNHVATDELRCRAPGMLQHPSLLSNKNTTMALSIAGDGDSEAIGTVLTVTSVCNSNSDCYDGNLCTIDKCEVGGVCSYQPIDSCGSIPDATKERSAPYVYYSHFSRNNSELFAFFVTQMDLLGDASPAEKLDDYPLTYVNLPFKIVYFGNLVTKAAISPNGVVGLEPLRECSRYQCILFTSATNALSPWFSDWSPGNIQPRTDIRTYFQRIDDGSNLFGVNANAFHVLFRNMYRISDSDKLPNSFAVSMYSDGSIRMSYIQIESLVEFGEFNGLWGAIASQSNYYLRYHSENISSSAVASGNSVMYCPSSSIACIPNSCVAAGEALVIHWTAPETCAAVGSDLSFKCLWSGLIETNASYFSGQVTCTVPPINISSGSITFVHLVTTFENDDGEIIYLSSFHEAGSNAEIPSYGQKDVYGVYIGGNEELSRSNLIVRYYDMSDKKPSNCGCGGLDNILSSSCDAQNVCGGNNTNGDCFGTAFGSAYIDACDVCSGGLTGIAPNSLCSSSSGNDYINLISQTIILLMIICCMTFITSSVSYSIRRLLANRSQNNTADPGFVLQLMEARGASARGLSEFECEALGQIIFSKEFYEQHQLEVARAASKNKGIDGSFSIIDFSSKEKSNEDRNTTCDCPICLMEIQDGSVCRVLPEPCMHLFHQECIDEWFHQSTMCPLCKRSIKSILDGTYEEETQPESIARSQSVSSLRHVDEDIQDVEMVGDGTNQHNTGSVRFSLRSAFMNSINQNGGDFRQILPQNEEVRAGGPRRFTAAQISSSTDSSTDLFGATSRISFAPADTSESQADQREGHENV